ncbi:MAG: metal-dependent transcriptional regulator [Clostridiales bacterium]|jgi:Mn-dependent DtxR family transcriptional regulator|nr:metal-dependent transcriptional regulator [Clostridiales bacterium]
MQLHQSGEDYLETIYILDKKTKYVRSIDIATELGYSKPSISRAMKILAKNNYIEVKDDGQIVLTEVGLEKAKNIYERHLLITEFLTNLLHVSEETAESDACKIEHVISNETYLKLKEFIDNYKNSNNK